MNGETVPNSITWQRAAAYVRGVDSPEAASQ